MEGRKYGLLDFINVADKNELLQGDYSINRKPGKIWSPIEPKIGKEVQWTLDSGQKFLKLYNGYFYKSQFIL